MENALLGLQYLKEIQSAINNPLLNEEYPEEVTQKIVYNLYDFWNVDIDKIYDELFLNYEFGILGDYKRLLSFVLNRLPSELEERGILNLQNYFEKEYAVNYENSRSVVRELSDLLENYEKDRLSIRGLSIQEMLDNGEYYDYEKKEHQFHQDYLSRISTLSSFGDKYMELETKIMTSAYFQLSEMLGKIKELYDLVLLKLNDIAQPEDVFIDSTLIWVAYRVFMKLDLVEDIDKDEFKNQFGYQNRPLTIEAKRKKKTLIAKTIYQLSQFVVPEYRVAWENKMAKHFKIKSYSKIKNKKGDSEEEFLLERMIKPFKDLL